MDERKRALLSIARLDAETYTIEQGTLNKCERQYSKYRSSNKSYRTVEA